MKILYVEDHPAQRDILAQMLELNGYEVAVASDGREGVQKAHEWGPDLILMDIRMPVMDGYEACTILKQKKTTQHIPVLFISAWASYRHKAKAFKVGAVEFMTKPVDLNKLLNTIKEIFDGIRLGIYVED